MTENNGADQIPRLLVGTRGSALALTQTDLIAQRLAARHPDLTIEKVIVRTEGDADKTSPLTVIGGRGVFTSALQDALRRREIDAGVHSAKDLPSEHPSDLRLIAFLAREDPRDVFISRHGTSLANLPENPLIGTSSRRRAVQVTAVRPDARIVDLRGNVDTRLRKAMETDLDGIVLAAAGVTRMGWKHFITEYLSLDQFTPSPGQGALAIETRAGDTGAAALLADLDEPDISGPVRVERAFLRAIGAGCTTPIGVFATLENDRLNLKAMLASDNGERVEWANETFDSGQAESAAADLARRMLALVSASPHRPGVSPMKPLDGMTVLVTRAGDQAAPLSDALRQRGATPIEQPTIRIADPASFAPLDQALNPLAAGEYDWVVFTSVNAVQRVLDRLQHLGQPLTSLRHVKLAAVGDATARALTTAGLSVELVPDRFVAEEVLKQLVARDVRGQRVLCPQGNLSRDVLPKGLREAGAHVDVVEMYQTLPVTQVNPTVRAMIRNGGVDVVTFASPSSARNLVAALGDDVVALRRMTVACIGPITAQAARNADLQVDVMAEDSTVDGLVKALVTYMGRRTHNTVEAQMQGSARS